MNERPDVTAQQAQLAGLVRESAAGTNTSLDDWRAFTERHLDLDDPEVMRQAWA